MVWNSTQSSLYRAVRDYNDEISHRECHSQEEKSPDCHSDEHCGTTSHQSCGQEECRNCCGCPHRKKPKQTSTPPLNTLNLDSDFLLIAGLILILYKNGADMKLIAALAVVLLG